MKTDPISAAVHYRQILQRIMHVTTMHEARQLASRALEATFDPPSAGMLSTMSGYGMNTHQPFVTFSMANPTESANPTIQLSTAQARQIAMQILEACDAAESDGFVVAWLQSEAELSESQATALLGAFRQYRERLRNKE